ncbi:MAG: HEAT repeat domain-containing protein, partial [Acidobacteria bacterium]
MTGQFVAGKATRDALFLTSLSFQALPTMLIAASVCSILLVAAHARWAAKLAPSALIQILFGVSGVLFLCEWVVRFSAPAATAVLLFLHTSAMGPLLTSGFWLIATERFDPRTAKRRFGQITGAGTLGGLLGALVSERVAATLGAPAMLLVLGSLQLLTVWLFSRFAAGAETGAEHEHPGPSTALGADPELPASTARSGLRTIAQAPHLRHLVVLVLLGSTSAALLDYLFKAKAVEAIGTGDQLLRFFALYYAATGLVTFILQMVSSRVALERFGLALTTSTPSIALLAGSIGGLVTPGFHSLMAARAGEAIFRGSWFRAGYELFYTPIPAAEKRAVKSIVDVGVDRAGDAFGGGLIRLAALLAPALQSPAILWMAIASSTVAILSASRLNHWYVRTLGTSLVSQAPDLGRSATEGQLTRSMLLKVRNSNRAAAHQAPDDTVDGRALRSGSRERAIEVLSREEGLNAALVSDAIQLLAGPLSDYALFALRKVAEERVGQLTDALLDPNQNDKVRRQLARVLAIGVSQRAVDALVLALDDERFDVRYQCARSLAMILARNPRVRIDRDRILEVVLREVAVGRPVWESRRQLEGIVNESPLDEFVRERAGHSLAHIFSLLSLILPSQPLQIAFQSLQSANGRLRGTALEYLEGVLPAEIRQQVWPFLVQGSGT